MYVIPAIDIRAGQCVRLTGGKFDKVEVFGDPLEIAKKWEKQGAKYLHVVDLDGAQTGEMKNSSIVKEIIDSTKLTVEVGGGIRDYSPASSLIKLGARVILGTAAFEKKNLVENLLREFGNERIGVAVDAIAGMLAIKGWQTKTEITATRAATEMEKLGVGFLLFTAVERDGFLKGPDLSQTKKIVESVCIPVIASGGVSSLENLEEVKKTGAWGVVVGKALYKNKFTLREAIGCCQKD